MRLWVTCLCASFLLGCANKGLRRYDAVVKRAASQEYLDAVDEIKKERASLYGSQSRLLYNMDVGILYHYAGRYDSSIAYLSRAADVHEELFARSVSNETASLLVNDNVRPYRGRSYEITWLHLFLAFDYLALGRVDEARVEVRRAQIFLNEEARKAGNDKGAFRDEAAFRAFSALIYEALGESDDAAISIYRAVKTLRARKKPVPPELAAYAWRLLDANDRDGDIRELGLSKPAGEAPLAKGQGEIVVVGALGRSPALGATEFKGTWVRDGLLYYSYTNAEGKVVRDVLPAPGLPQSEYDKADRGRNTRSGTTLNIKWSMPALRDVPVQSRELRVATDSRNVSGETWADTRDLLTEDLEENRGALLARTVVRVAARTLTAEKAKSEMRTDNPIVNLLLSLGTDFLADQLEQADVRLWFLLPRTLQVARIPAEAGTHALQIGAEAADGRVVRAETREVTVRPGRKTFVFFNSLK